MSSSAFVPIESIVRDPVLSKALGPIHDCYRYKLVWPSEHGVSEMSFDRMVTDIETGYLVRSLLAKIKELEDKQKELEDWIHGG